MEETAPMPTTDRVNLTAKQAKDLRSSRISCGISQAELAALAGVTRPKIKRIEKWEVAQVRPAELEAILQALAGKPRKASGSSNGTSGSSNGRAPSRRRKKGASGRTKIAAEASAPRLDERMQAEVRRRLRESVLDVMRDLIGDSGRVLVEKHKLHDVTLGHLFRAS